MNPEIEQIEEAREYLDPAWTEERSKDALSKVKRGYARRRTAKIGGAVAAVAAVCLAVPIVFGKLQPETLPHHQNIEVSSNHVDVSQGFRVTPLNDAAKFAVSSVSAEEVKVELNAGKVHFDVTSMPGRTYHVAVQGVDIRVVGTSFDVESAEESVTIHLHEGSVAVSSQELGEAFIMQGESTRTIQLKSREIAAVEEAPKELAETDVVEEAEPMEAPKAAEEPEARVEEPKPWRELAQKKDFAAASEILLKDPKLVNRKKVEELFDAADAMRRSGHHAEASSYLKMISKEHASDSRAGMAAHTRGRILSRRLSNHCEAAEAFAEAREIGLEGMLQRDALAHQTEALVRCGEVAKAKERLEAYKSEYPTGPHLSNLETLLQGSP